MHSTENTRDYLRCIIIRGTIAKSKQEARHHNSRGNKFEVFIKIYFYALDVMGRTLQEYVVPKSCMNFVGYPDADP